MTEHAWMDEQGRPVALDADGHLLDPTQWSRELAEAMAERDGLALTDEHWWLIEFVRDHHVRYGTPPLTRAVIGQWRKDSGDSSLGSRELYRLFSEHPVREACRLGGYPKPSWCL